MRTRNESLVYYDSYIHVEKLEEFLKTFENTPHKVTLTHAVLKAATLGFHENPKMNQYISGGRLYRRDKIELSFSLKKQKVSHSPLKIIKMEFKATDPIEEIADRTNAALEVERSDKKTYVDKEVNLLTLLPCFLLSFLSWFARFLDYYNLLPYSFIRKDPLYASMFIANLGSLGMDAGFHHLYEYGTIPLFCVVGKIQEMPVAENGQVVVRRMLHIRWTYDERIDDGMTAGIGIATFVKAMEDPLRYLATPAK